MNQIKIGKFIATCRKSKNLTQAQLAEKLGITDKAVSKWERGIAMPDSSVMLELCQILEITVNDLLSGEVVLMENYNKEMENKILEMVKQKEESDKRLLAFEWVIAILSGIVLLIPIVAAPFLQIEEWKQQLVAISGIIPAIIGLVFALKIEQVAGYYECKCCGHKYLPTFKAVNLAMHMGRTRYMKCPKCGKKSWQKKVINDD